MTKIGIIRCEKNERKCPLTSCIKCHDEQLQGFGGYDECSLAGVFTCRCPGDDFTDMVRIMKAKGAEAVHVVTCTFSGKQDGSWKLGNGFCDGIDDLAEKAATETGIPVIKGTAHLPEGYSVETFK
ncbi:CGGC domain-containing protein [Maridesulfovibrio sp.]|uniref:CGGC domain-containing protein n=1 Tax=Maridesulfovibrio sp. TaxID=2795000 RepID=UPI002A18866A|nr:CGGC domain-containing protein [Maridesulfovibrio sp.]